MLRFALSINCEKKDNSESKPPLKGLKENFNFQRIPSFLGKPEIIPMGGKVIRLIVRYKSSCKCNCSWYHNDEFVSESNTKQIFHDKIALNSYQYGLEIYEPNSKSAGLYKCMVKNDHGQLQVNLNLNIEPDGQVASTIKTSEAPQATKKIEKKRVKVTEFGRL